MKTSDEAYPDEPIDVVLADFLKRLDAGEPVNRQQFLAEHPELKEQLQELLEAADWIELLAGPTLAELNVSPLGTPLESSRKNQLVDPATDFSVDEPLDASEATIEYRRGRHAISLSNAGRILSRDGETTDGTDQSDLSDLIRVGPENTQPVLPCRFGDYTLERILGRGGMGVVYLAKQLTLERRVAIKMIRSGCLAGENEIERFYTEARSAARLDHPNIVSVYQCGEIDGHHYFSMDYVEGADLAKRIQAKPLTFREAARYVRDVALAIEYAHAQGVLHRDLKPANVIIDPDDEIVITDFGLAKLMDSDEGLTRSGTALGTPSYMSPEQADGNQAEQGAATDVYALGAILYATLTGQPPFQGANMIQTVMDVIHKPAPRVRHIRKEVPLDLDTIVAKCLEKNPKKRYASAQSLADELDRFLNHQPIHARPMSMLRRIYRWILNIPIVAAVFGSGMITPTAAHRWTQRAMLGTLLILATLLFIGTRLPRWWSDLTLPKRVSIAAGDAEGAYFALAGKLAENFEAITHLQPTIEVTVGSMENVQRLVQRQAELALVQGTVINDNRIAVVAPLYYEAIHVLIRRSAKIKDFGDLAERKLAIGKNDSGTRQAIDMLQRMLPKTFDLMKTVECDWSELSNMPELDGAFAVVRLGHPQIRAMIESGEYSLISIPDVQRISLSEPAFRPYELSEQDYPTVELSLRTLATPAFLAARSDASARLVETTLRAIYESKAPIEGLIPIETASHWQGLPLHPAARRYFEITLEESD